MDVLANLRTVTTALDEAAIPYALVGGWAVAVHGAPRATADLDLLIRPADLEPALAAVEPHGFRHKAMPMKFPDGMRLQRVSKIEQGELLTLDLLLVVELLEPVWESREPIEALGTTLWVIGRDALISMKQWAGRPQDLADIARLLGDDR